MRHFLDCLTFEDYFTPCCRLVDFNAATLETLRVDQKLTEAPTLVFEWAPDNNTVIIDEQAPKPVPLRVEIPRIWQIEMILTLDDDVWDKYNTTEATEQYWRFYKMIERFSRSSDYRIMFGLPAPIDTSSISMSSTDTWSTTQLPTTEKVTTKLATTQSDLTTEPSIEAQVRMTTQEIRTETTAFMTTAETTEQTSDFIPTTVVEELTTKRIEKPVLELLSGSGDYETGSDTDDEDLSTPPPETSKVESSMSPDVFICSKEMSDGSIRTWPTDYKGSVSNQVALINFKTRLLG